MQKNAFFMELFNVKNSFLPVDLNAGANTGARMSMKGCKRIVFLTTMGDSTSAVATFSFQQHNAASAGTSKALTHMNPYYHKIAALTVFTKVQPTSAASSFDLATQFAGDEGIVVFEILAEDLDVANDFAWVSMDIADTTAAKVGSSVAIFVGNTSLPPYGDAV